MRTRQAKWAGALSTWLARRRVQPNHISVLGAAFAVLAGVSLVAAGQNQAGMSGALFLVAAALIQLRLLCNLLDGMVAIEGGLKTASGEIFNDLPDRVSDAFILVGAGYAVSWVGSAPLGWGAALLAVLTAYVRVLGGSMGTPQYFIGPMAKQHRMALMTAACTLAGIDAVVGAGTGGQILLAALTAVALGCVITIIRRVQRIAADLEAR